ncbi:hypothetical protein AB4Y72_00695 [Arthrobacter sp. YAF34]
MAILHQAELQPTNLELLERLVLTGTWDGQKNPIQLAAITNT